MNDEKKGMKLVCAFHSMISSAIGIPKHIMNYAFTERSAKSTEACSRMQKVIDSGGLI